MSYSWLTRLRAIRLRHRAAQELDDELRFHVEMESAENVAAGLPPDEARRLALARLGSALRTKEDVRAVLGIPFESVWDDLRIAGRSLRRTPGFTAIAVLALALGIGATSGLFTLVNALWLRPIAVAEPDRLAVFYARTETVRTQPGGAATRGLPRDDGRWAEVATLAAGSSSFLSVAAEGSPPSETMLPRLALPGAPPLVATPVSWNYFRTLGVPVRGRDFAPDDDVAGAHPVVIISERLWRSRFDGDPELIGRVLAVGTRSIVVVGVAAPRFHGSRLGDQVDVWIPLRMTGEFLPNIPPAAFHRMPQALMPLRAIGRLRPGTTLAEAEAEVVRLDARSGRFLRTLADSAYPARAQDAEPDDRRLALLLSAAVALVLLVGCLSLSGLLLARAEGRRQEVAVRLALGIPRWRLVRLLAGEAILLSVLGGLAALAVSQLLLRSLPRSTLPTGIPIAGLDLSLDWRVMAFTGVLTLATVLVCSLAPVTKLARENLAGVIAAARAPWGSTHRTGRAWLLGVHVAMALVLLVGTGLLTRSVRNALATDMGFAANHTAFLLVVPNLARYADATLQQIDFQRRQTDYDDLQARIRAIPGVQAVAEGSSPLLASLADGERPVPRAMASGRTVREVILATLAVGPSFCSTVGVPIVAGRDLLSSDAVKGAPRVAVVGERLASVMWPGEPPIGLRFSLPSRPRNGTAGDLAARSAIAPTGSPTGEEYEVVGLAGDTVRRGIRGARVDTIYLPRVQDPDEAMGRPGFGLAIRTDPPIRGLVRSIETVARDVLPDAYTLKVSTVADQVAEQMASPRLGATLFAWFSLVAAGLGALGIWGLVASALASRTHELGVRLALGATSAQVLRTVASSGILPVLAGSVVGLIAAAGLGRWLADLLFGVGPTDALTFAVAAAVCVVAGVVASVAPARRVLRLDPATILRSE